MKQRDLLRYLEIYGCRLRREGRRHTIFYNPSNNRTSSIPRHREINENLARKICRDLGIPEPR